jgi:hypothetical protein
VGLSSGMPTRMDQVTPGPNGLDYNQSALPAGSPSTNSLPIERQAGGFSLAAS